MFGKLAYVQKRSGNPFISPHKQRAKIIYREIQSKIQAIALDKADNNSNPTPQDTAKAKKVVRFSARAKKRYGPFPLFKAKKYL